MKLCANLSFMFQEHECLLSRYRAAKEAGFTGVECAFPYTIDSTKVKETLDTLGLQQVLINAIPGDNFGFGARPGEEDEFMSSLVGSLAYCKALGCNKLHMMAGKKMEGVGKEEAMETFKQNLETAIPLLEEAGVTGLIEPINKVSLPDYNMEDFSDAVNLVKQINHPNIRLQMDIFHLQQLEGNLSAKIVELLPHVGHIQIAQVPDRGEPDSAGEINYIDIFQLLQTLNYQGWVGLEYKPVNSTVEGLGWIKQMGMEKLL